MSLAFPFLPLLPGPSRPNPADAGIFSLFTSGPRDPSRELNLLTNVFVYPRLDGGPNSKHSQIATFFELLACESIADSLCAAVEHVATTDFGWQWGSYGTALFSRLPEGCREHKRSILVAVVLLATDGLSLGLGRKALDALRPKAQSPVTNLRAAAPNRSGAAGQNASVGSWPQKFLSLRLSRAPSVWGVLLLVAEAWIKREAVRRLKDQAPLDPLPAPDPEPAVDPPPSKKHEVGAQEASNVVGWTKLHRYVRGVLSWLRAAIRNAARRCRILLSGQRTRGGQPYALRECLTDFFFQTARVSFFAFKVLYLLREQGHEYAMTAEGAIPAETSVTALLRKTAREDQKSAKPAQWIWRLPRSAMLAVDHAFFGKAGVQGSVTRYWTPAHMLLGLSICRDIPAAAAQTTSTGTDAGAAAGGGDASLGLLREVWTAATSGVVTAGLYGLQAASWWQMRSREGRLDPAENGAADADEDLDPTGGYEQSGNGTSTGNGPRESDGRAGKDNGDASDLSSDEDLLPPQLLPFAHSQPEKEENRRFSEVRRRERRPRVQLLQESSARPVSDMCSLCRRPLRNRAQTISGHLFCYGCLYDWVSEHGSCPVSTAPMTPSDIRRVILD